MGEVARQAIEDPENAPIDERLKVTLAFLSKLTLRPAELEASDLEPLRAAGLSDEAIEEAIEVAFLFNTIDRLADAFDFPLSTGREKLWVVRMLTKMGYGGAVL